MVDSGSPYVIPLHFASRVVEGRIVAYAHGAPEGRKWRVLAADSRACLEASRRIALVEGTKACKFGATFESVILEGTAGVCTDMVEKKWALTALMDKYAPGAMDRFEPFTDAQAGLVEVLRFEAETWSAKARM
jgi:nitroimidazol reductase NimA-like FMN-containing flavoprotein (pyridoxamine 5'-phosphate oxidase superfamily)